jgi:hypothetical protein
MRSRSDQDQQDAERKGPHRDSIRLKPAPCVHRQARLIRPARATPCVRLTGDHNGPAITGNDLTPLGGGVLNLSRLCCPRGGPNKSMRLKWFGIGPTA